MMGTTKGLGQDFTFLWCRQKKKYGCRRRSVRDGLGRQLARGEVLEAAADASSRILPPLSRVPCMTGATMRELAKGEIDRPLSLSASRGVGSYPSHEPDARVNSLRSVLDSIMPPLVVLDSRGVIRAVNDSWKRFLMDAGGDSGAGVGADYFQVWRRTSGWDDEREGELRAGIHQVVEGQQPLFTWDFSCQTSARERWLEFLAIGLAEGGVVVVHRDIAEPCGGSDHRSHFLRQLLAAQEHQRRHIARELHDGICQSLTAILLGLQVVQTASTLEEARDAAQELRRLAAVALMDLRRLARSLGRAAGEIIDPISARRRDDHPRPHPLAGGES